VGLGHCAHDGQAEPRGGCPVAAAAHEAVEDVWRNLLGDARAIVLDGQQRMPVLRGGRGAYVGSLGRVAQGVLQQVDRDPVQFVPWGALVVMVVALVLLVARPSRRALTAVRILAVAVMLTAGFGIFEHVLANYEAAPLDFRYTDRWATMSAPSRWWAAASEAVGPSPTLAPGVLAQSSLCLLFATLGHPARAEERPLASPPQKASTSSR